jgi:hypothetical protein
MAAKDIFRAAKRALQTEQGRSGGRKLVDGLAKAGDKATKGKHRPKIEQARQAAHRYLGGPGSGGPGSAGRGY